MSEPIIELTIRGSDTVVAHACGKCRRVAHDERMARQCCEPILCECGATCRRGWTACDDCLDRKAQARERNRFEKAEKVSWRDYDGPVYWERPCGDYWSTATDFVDELACDSPPSDCPPYVWACTRYGLTMDAQGIVHNQLERQEHHEDAADWIVGIDELQTAMDDWLNKQSVESWAVDYTRAVLLDGLVEEVWP